MKLEKFTYNLNDISQGETKSSGMPLDFKIFIGILIFMMLGYFGYEYGYKKYIVKPAPAKVVEKVFGHTGGVIVVKCKDFKDISLYLESDITLDQYKTTLDAVASIPSATLVIPNQELTFNTSNGRVMVYKCQVEKGVLIGKLRKI